METKTETLSPMWTEGAIKARLQELTCLHNAIVEMVNDNHESMSTPTVAALFAVAENIKSRLADLRTMLAEKRPSGPVQ